MKAATLFSGIGAPETAMPSWEWIWHAEIEAFPSAVIKARHPESVNLGDVNAEDFVERAERVGRPDVLVFGSPCQSFSVAGKRLGLDDARGNLALVGLGIAKRLRTRWLVFENVPGLFSSYSGSEQTESALRGRADAAVGETADADEDSDFAAFLSALRECGYLGCYRVFDAQHSGVPQRRRRIFFVGRLGDWRPPVAVLLEPDSLRGDSPPSREAREGVAGTISAGLERCSADEAERATLIAPPINAGMGKRRGSGAHGDGMVPLIANPLTARMHKGVNTTGDEGQTMIPVTLQTRGSNVRVDTDLVSTIGTNADRASGSAPMVIAFDWQATRESGDEECTGTLRSQHSGSLAMFKPSHFTRGKDGAPDDLSPPLSADADKGDQDPVLMAGAAVRRLTPRECERLQGFGDDHTLITHRRKPAADGPRYRALGNSMNVKDIGPILRRIDLFEKTMGET